MEKMNTPSPCPQGTNWPWSEFFFVELYWEFVSTENFVIDVCAVQENSMLQSKNSIGYSLSR